MKKLNGTVDIIRLSKETGIKEPVFLQDEDFKTILYRKTTEEVTKQGDSKLGDKLAAVENQLAKLKKKGILLRHGTKGGYWEISKESNE
jgi:predicted HTH transcriptional regulator